MDLTNQRNHRSTVNGPLRIWIVNSSTEFPGGGCPDLPDSSWTTKQAARDRVKQLYESDLESYKKMGIKKENMEIKIDKDWDSAEICAGVHYWSYHYVVGSVPLCDTLEEFNNLPVPFKPEE